MGKENAYDLSAFPEEQIMHLYYSNNLHGKYKNSMKMDNCW